MWRLVISIIPIFFQVHSFLPVLLSPHMTTTPRIYMNHNVTPDIFEQIQDNHGYPALQKRKSPSSHNDSSCYIRIQGQTDACLKDIHTSLDIWNEIQRVKEIQFNQSHGRDVEPYPRYWKPVPVSKSSMENYSTEKTNSSSTITFLQFNTLAEGLSAGPHVSPCFSDCDTHLLTQPKDEAECIVENDVVLNNCFGGFTQLECPDIILDFTLRRWRLVEILLGFDVIPRHMDAMNGSYDIIAVEEMDRYYGFFQPLLATVGYQGVFAPKTNAPGIKLGYYSDGCALFWRKEKFHLLSSKQGAYTLGSQVYVIATLRHVPSQRIMIVAVTHLKAKEGTANEAMRYTQAIQLSQAVTEAAREAENKWCTSTRESSNIPIFIMGDFNSHPIPECTTAGEESNTKIMSCLDAFIANKSSLSSPPYGHFSSVYPIHPTPNDFFSTWKTRGPKTTRLVIDYILHTHVDGIQLSHILSVPHEDEMEPCRLPGFKYPSDHIALGAKFQIERL